MIEAPAKPVRGKDRGKLMAKLGNWHAPVLAGEFDGGFKLLYLPHHKDTTLLGQLMHHCSGTHFVWSEEERIWYFFALVDKNGVPVATLHTKEEKWLNKKHPRDLKAVRMPVVVRPNSGLYTSKQDVLDAFEKAKIPYEPKYYALNFASTTYDSGASYGDANGGFRWRNALPNKPDGVDPTLYKEYMRCWKAMEDHYNKKVGAIKINGRVFYYDGKKQIVLSLSGGAQSQSLSNVRQMVFEWLNSRQRKDKALDLADI